MKIMCNSKCQLLKAVRDHYNKINEEDLKHVKILKICYIRGSLKIDLLLKK